MCTFYRNKRAELIRIVSQFCRVTIDCLLRGNNYLLYQTNARIFEAVQAYIKETNARIFEAVQAYIKVGIIF